MVLPLGPETGIVTGLGRTALAASPLKVTADVSGICSVAPNETGPMDIIGTAMEDGGNK